MHWGLSGSSGVAGFIEVRHRGDGFTWGRYIVRGARWVLSGSCRVARFIDVHSGGRPVLPGSLGCALGVVGFLRGR